MLSPLQTSLIEHLLNTKAILFGNYTLKNGKASPIFLDLSMIYASNAMEFVNLQIANLIYTKFPQADCIIGPAYKGIPLASCTSLLYMQKYQKVLPAFFSRKEQKPHGEGGLFFGPIPQISLTENNNNNNNNNLSLFKSYKYPIIIDDVISDGKTKFDSFQTLHTEFNLSPAGIVVVVDRRLPEILTQRKETPLIQENKKPFPCPLFSLITLDNIASYLTIINHPFAAILNSYLHTIERI